MKFVRWKGLIPFLIVVLVVYVFTSWYMDGLIKRAIEKQGTRINGALVEVESVSLSFLRSRFSISGLRVTDPRDLLKNRFESGRIVADLRFLPLLKKKFVADDLRIESVRWGTARTKPGEVPEKWRKEWAKEREEARKGTPWAQKFAELQKKYTPELPDIDFEALGEKFDPRGFVQIENLESYRKIQTLPGELKELSSRWEDRIKSYSESKAKELESLKTNVAQISSTQVQNPQEALAAIERVREIKRQIEAQKKDVKNFQDQAQAELVSKIEEASRLPEILAKDIENAKNRVGLGGLNFDSLSQGIIGPDLLNRYDRFLWYYRTGTRWMSKVKGASTSKEQETKRPRWKGRIVYFPITDPTPKFLVREFSLSADTSENSETGESWKGTYRMQGKDISSNPHRWGNPIQVDAQAKLADGMFTRADASFTYSQPKVDSSHLTAKAGIEGYGLKDFEIGKASIFSIPLKSGKTSLSSSLDIREKEINLELSGRFFELVYSFPESGNQNQIVKLVREVVSEVKSFDLKLEVQGDPASPRFSISSSLDGVLKRGLQAKLFEKLKAAQAKVEKFIRDEMDSKVKAVRTQSEDVKSQTLSRVNAQIEKVNEIEQMADEKIRALQKKQDEFVKGKADQLREKVPKPKMDGVKKKFGF